MQSLLATCNLSESTRVRFTTDGKSITVERLMTDALGIARWDAYTEADEIKPESEIRALVGQLSPCTGLTRVLSELTRAELTYRLVQLHDSDLVIERRETDALDGVAWRECATSWTRLDDAIRGDVAELLVLAIPRVS